MPRLIITGATGFVGRRVAHLAAQAGWETIAAVRKPGAVTNTTKSIVVGEIDGETQWPLDELRGSDAVVHLAARVHQFGRAASADREFERVNVEGTLALAQAAMAAGVRRFVHVSSVHAVATLADELLDETSPCRPDSAYGRSKLKAEDHLRELADAGLGVVIVRPPPVYGPGQQGRLGDMIAWAGRGRVMPLGGLGNLRSVVFVDNLADALLHAAVHPQAAGETFFVSDGRPLALRELAELAAAANGKRLPILPAPQMLLRFLGRITGKSAAVERWLGSLAVDSSKLERLLNWKPPYSTAEGLECTLRPELQAEAVQSLSFVDALSDRAVTLDSAVRPLQSRKDAA